MFQKVNGALKKMHMNLLLIEKHLMKICKNRLNS